MSLLRYVYNQDGVPQFHTGCDHPLVESVAVPEVVAWLREQGAIDYGAATNITRELTSHLPADFEGSYDATVWTLNIVDAALGLGGEVDSE